MSYLDRIKKGLTLRVRHETDTAFTVISSTNHKVNWDITKGINEAFNCDCKWAINKHEGYCSHVFSVLNYLEVNNVLPKGIIEAEIKRNEL